MVNQPEFTIALSRSLSRLKQLYFVLVANAANPTNSFKQRITALASVSTDNDVMSWQVQAGSAKYPDNECLGVGESFFRLLQASGHEKDKDDIAISPTDYVTDAAIFGIDFEKAGNEALFTGITTQDDQLFTRVEEPRCII